jgi:hypothetical protein
MLDARTGAQQALLERPAVATDTVTAGAVTLSGITWHFGFGDGGAWLATAGSDGLRFWEPSSGRQVAVFERLVYHSLAVDPSGGWLAAAHASGTVALHALAP